jgi:putative GTP pyrophosphokinase
LNDTKTAKEWGEEFSRERGQYVAFTQALERLLAELLESGHIDAAQLETRTKTVESFSDKITRKKDKYADPLSEITDLSGLRVTLYYAADVAAVGNVIEQEFDVDWANSVRQGADTEPDRFGYRSDHYVIRVGERCQYAEWKRFEELRAEIQVRTVMQHAWAAVDHKIRYKSTDLPRDLQRRLFRLSALLEVADEQFAALQLASDATVISYEEAVARGSLHVPLDVLSLRAYLDQKNIADEWAIRAASVGFRSFPPSIAKDALEEERPARTEELLIALRDLGLTSLDQFAAWLRSTDQWGERALQAVVRETANFASEAPAATLSPGLILAIPEHVLLILAQLASGSDEIVEKAHWRKDIAAGIKASFDAAASPQRR